MSEIDEIIGYEFDYFDGPAEEDIELLKISELIGKYLNDILI